MEIEEQASGGRLERAVVRSEALLRSAPRPVIFGALGGVLALAFALRRANKRRRQRNGERGDSVLGVVVKSAFTAAIATVPKVYFLRLAKSALHHDDSASARVGAGRSRPTLSEPNGF
jgi:hypothetical protein